MIYVSEATRNLNYRECGLLSGSAQPSFSDAQQIADRVTLFINLRSECILYYDKRPVSASSDGPLRRIPSIQELLNQERNLKSLQFVSLAQRKSDPAMNLEIQEAKTEDELVGGRTRYERVPIENHSFPTGLAIDSLVGLYDEYRDKRVHFHCGGGKGRTTMAIAIWAILEKPKEPLLLTLTGLEGWGNSSILGCNRCKARNNPVFWLRFQYFAKNRVANQSWTNWIARNSPS
ncbi:MAG: hypothetical protein S4CHLAM81_13280 [Chlamydiales bacterium]|nr:hypothetical protein [Chlamydiales bacterium]MCH9636100.1 hypothetical protein [Chlamydiales bacterium]MCH9703468.1 hypothetical protein [Chlamydiota bacterium]